MLILGLLTPASGLDAQARHEFTQVHMGMPVRIVLHAPTDSTARAAARAAFRHIAQLEDVLSDFRPDSELRRLEQRAGIWVDVSAPLFDVLQRALLIARLTDGAFDPTIAPLSALWRDARRTGTPPTSIAIEAARRHVGWHRLQLDSTRRAVLLPAGMRLDLGAIAKGYILQHALAVLERHGSVSALVEAGGDIVVGAAPPGRAGWTIAVPGADAAFAARAAALTHAAIATSGANYQYVDADGTRYSHIIDPRTGRGVEALHVARVIAADAATADALASALSVLGPAGLARVGHAFADVLIDVSAAR